jgi:hypothetical protein
VETRSAFPWALLAVAAVVGAIVGWAAYGYQTALDEAALRTFPALFAPPAQKPPAKLGAEAKPRATASR